MWPLKLTIALAAELELKGIQIFGESLLVINWFNQKVHSTATL